MGLPIPFSVVRQKITELLPDVFVQEAEGDLFFFAGTERKFPFATILTHDNRYDNFSKLDNSGFYRLSAGVSPTTFQSLVPNDSSHDFVARNVITPNPVYGKMHWLSVLSPEEETLNTFLEFVSESHALQISRSKKRSGFVDKPRLEGTV